MSQPISSTSLIISNMMDNNLKILYWMRANGHPTGSKYFYGKGEDEDYFVTFDDLLIMEKEHPYTAAIITNQPKHGKNRGYKIEDGEFFSAKLFVGGVILNVIVTKPEEYLAWAYATNEYMDKHIDCEIARKDKKVRVAIFEHLKKTFREESGGEIESHKKQ